MFNLLVIIITAFLYFIIFYLFIKILIWFIAHLVCAVKTKVTEIDNKDKEKGDRD